MMSSVQRSSRISMALDMGQNWPYGDMAHLPGSFDYTPPVATAVVQILYRIRFTSGTIGCPPPGGKIGASETSRTQEAEMRTEQGIAVDRALEDKHRGRGGQ